MRVDGSGLPSIRLIKLELLARKLVKKFLRWAFRAPENLHRRFTEALACVYLLSLGPRRMLMHIHLCSVWGGKKKHLLLSFHQDKLQDPIKGCKENLCFSLFVFLFTPLID